MGENGESHRGDPDPALGGLDEDLRRAQHMADDPALNPFERDLAWTYAQALRRAIGVLTGRPAR